LGQVVSQTKIQRRKTGGNADLPVLGKADDRNARGER
jgi:hypothetical protein